jgi:hypothetical protein
MTVLSKKRKEEILGNMVISQEKPQRRKVN